MNVILSIKPKYCDRIKKGTKKYEFRRRGFRQNVGFVYIYSTSPVNKIVGLFSVESIVHGHPETLWKSFKEYSGTEEEEFFEYFKSCKQGCAIKIKDVKMFEPLDPKAVFPCFSPPQSYVYVNSLATHFWQARWLSHNPPRAKDDERLTKQEGRDS